MTTALASQESRGRKHNSVVLRTAIYMHCFCQSKREQQNCSNARGFHCRYIGVRAILLYDIVRDSGVASQVLETIISRIVARS